MKIGLIHGRFQPFHNGHKFLVDKMIKECDVSVILIGSVAKHNDKNIFDIETRKMMIKSVYGRNKKLFIGANLDLDSPYSKNAQWDIVFSSCVLSLTGYLPTHVYAGDNYSVAWKRVKPKIKKFNRFGKISASNIRKLIYSRNIDTVEKLVPRQIFKIIKSSDKPTRKLGH